MNPLGSKDNPIRCSSLPMLLTCSGFIRMREMYGDESGVAATLGTAVGRGIELWHLGTPVDEAIEIAKKEASGQAAPLGKKELDELTLVVTSYAEDERNAGDVVLTDSLELELTFEYGGIWFSGHVDQIRQGVKFLELWDVKMTRRYTGTQAVSAYAAQLCAYAYGATLFYGEPVIVGGIVRVTGYISPKTNLKLEPSLRPVFFGAGWDLDVCKSMLDQCVYRVNALNANEPLIAPGSHCNWCPATSPNNCVRLLDK